MDSKELAAELQSVEREFGNDAKAKDAAKTKLIGQKKKALALAKEVLEKAREDRAAAERIVRAKQIEVNNLQAEITALI